MTGHGDHKYTLREFLLMVGLNRGDDWTGVQEQVTRELASHLEWDGEARNTYANWEAWYRWNTVDS